jgi:hypothetical protein
VLTISDEALAIIRTKPQPVHLDMPPAVDGGCCASIQECPTVRFGEPRDPHNYVEQTIQGVRVLLPRRMPRHGKFTLTVSRFFWMKSVVLEGWCPF